MRKKTISLFKFWELTDEIQLKTGMWDDNNRCYILTFTPRGAMQPYCTVINTCLISAILFTNMFIREYYNKRQSWIYMFRKYLPGQQKSY